MKEILEIVKKRDEYPLSIEISNNNAKGDSKLTLKVRGELPEKFTAENLEKQIQMVIKVYKKHRNEVKDA